MGAPVRKMTTVEYVIKNIYVLILVMFLAPFRLLEKKYSTKSTLSMSMSPS